MIKANELRIGNYVLCNDGLPIKIREIKKESILYLYKGKNWYNLELKYLKPIPLTKEILIKCGFELIGVNWHFEGKNIFKCIDMFICDRFGTKIKYVHELQNWYYVNSNKKELTIQL